MPPLMEFQDVRFSYPDGEPLFSGLNLAIEPGAFYLIQGPSGSGKSTLLRLANRLEEPTGGRVLFHGRPLSDLPPAGLRQSVVMIQQTPVALDASVRENLLLPFGFRGNQGRRPPDGARLRVMLRDYGLEKIGLEANALTLSVGQLQRVCLIRGLLLEPELLLLDEPTSALDPESREIVELAAERAGRTVLFITHAAYRPRTVPPRILRIQNGNALLDPQ